MRSEGDMHRGLAWLASLGLVAALLALLISSLISSHNANSAADKANAALATLHQQAANTRRGQIVGCQRGNVQIRVAINRNAYRLYRFATDAATARRAEGKFALARKYQAQADGIRTLRFVDCIQAADYPEVKQVLTQPGPPLRNGFPPGQHLPDISSVLGD